MGSVANGARGAHLFYYEVRIVASSSGYALACDQQHHKFSMFQFSVASVSSLILPRDLAGAVRHVVQGSHKVKYGTNSYQQQQPPPPPQQQPQAAAADSGTMAGEEVDDAASSDGSLDMDD